MDSDNQHLNVAVIQMSSSADEQENLQQACKFLSTAAKLDCDLVLLPENVLCHGTHEQIKTIAKEESKWLEILKQFSITNSLNIVWGGIPIKCEDKLFNMSLVIDKTGVLIANYAKNHLFDLNGVTSESEIYTPGTEKSEFEIKGWRVALSICFEIRLADFFQQYNSPDLILCSAAFTQKTGKAHWELLCRTRAVENQCYLAAANQHTTSEVPFQTFGYSMLINPWGNIKERIKTESGIITSSLLKQKIFEIRETMPLNKQNGNLFDSFRRA